MIAVYLFMRGHNEPGGGFVAGLVLSTAFILQYIVSGTQWVEANMRLMPQRWIAVGLLLATATGLGALGLGYPFLTTHTAHLNIPLIGEVHVASALFYDIGVFALVLGATMLILTALGHQSAPALWIRRRLWRWEDTPTYSTSPDASRATYTTSPRHSSRYSRIVS